MKKINRKLVQSFSKEMQKFVEKFAKENDLDLIVLSGVLTETMRAQKVIFRTESGERLVFQF